MMRKVMGTRLSRQAAPRVTIQTVNPNFAMLAFQAFLGHFALSLLVVHPGPSISQAGTGWCMPCIRHVCTVEV